ncbi:hypothetical protein [Nocardioides lijunqiniae]|uniref:hypothetical protein n=1 Tax=Nocardioides lijunqiniae TaxID=2760832 RepID=UPI001877A3B6|nr:hypothetical protein [Nocardioides lijunqiniae]
MPLSLKTSAVAGLAALLLATGCSGGGDDAEGGPEPTPSETTSASPPASPEPTPTPTPTPTTSASPSPSPTTAPDAEGDFCAEVTAEEATRLYGRPVTVSAGGSCSFQEEDFVEQDINVAWQLDPAPRATMASIRRDLGVRSDDAERTTLAGGVPAWEVRLTDVKGVMIAALVEGRHLFVTVLSDGVHLPARPIPEMAAIARGIAESYTV